MTDDSTAKGEATEPEEMELTRQEIRIRDLAVKILVARIAHCVATDGEYDVHGEAREAYEDALEASEEFDKRTRLRRRFCALSRTNRGDNALQRGMGGSMTDDYRPEDVGELSPRERERRSLAIKILMARYNEHLADKETEHPWWGSFGERGLDAYEAAKEALDAIDIQTQVDRDHGGDVMARLSRRDRENGETNGLQQEGRGNGHGRART